MATPPRSWYDNIVRKEIGMEGTKKLFPRVLLLEDLRKLLSKDGVYPQRIAALIGATTKEDPFDCGYVMAAVKVLLMNSATWLECMSLIRSIADSLTPEEIQRIDRWNLSQQS